LVRGKNGYDLSGFLIDDVPGKALAQIAEESKAKLSMLRKGGDPAMRRADTLSRITPQWILSLMLPIHAWLGYSLNLDPRPIGFPKDNFGAFMVSSIGALGLEHGLIPLSPYSRVPLIIGVGKPRLRPNVRDGQVVAEKMVRLTFTFDHRLADGVHGAILMKRLTDAFEKPESFHA
jgi:pyruvate dehydrogenase E2 component (dihydrolipoamide acetyltransferase)